MGVGTSTESTVKANHSGRDFDRWARSLSSNYHKERGAPLHSNNGGEAGGASVVGKAVVDKDSSSHLRVINGSDESKLQQQRSSPPRPRAERKRLSRQLQRSSVAVARIDSNGSDDDMYKSGSKNAAEHDAGGRVLLTHATHHVPTDEQDPAVERHEMIGLARTLG